MVTTTQPKVVLTESLDDEVTDWLCRHVHVVRQSDEDPAAFARQMADAQGVIVRTYTNVNEAFLKLAPNLKVIGRAGVGLDNFDLDACRRAGVRVVYTPSANTQAVVEWTWGLIFDAVRPRLYMAGYMPPPLYHGARKKHVCRQLDEMVLGVFGMGRIGRRMADVARGIGMRVLYNDLLNRQQLNLPPDDPSEFVDKPTLWSQADILSIHVDGRRENRHIINAPVLAQLKPSCIIVNAARGMLIDSGALADWARRVQPAGGMALLDVQDPEPPPDDYPLFGLANVCLTPHLAARTHRGLRNMAWVVKDVVRVLEGQPPEYPAV